MTKQPKISACLLIWNEGENIYKCLNSIKNVVSEVIIILDTKTDDNTVEEIQRFTADHKAKNDFDGLYNCLVGDRIVQIKLFHKEWNDHFADMRNYSLSKATGDYIFVIDGDEVLERWQDIDGESDYYLAKYRLNDGERDFFGYQIRIFKKGIEYTGQRHATVEENIKGLKGATVSTVVKSDCISAEEIDKRVDRDIRLFTENPSYASNYYISSCYYFRQDWENVIKYGCLALEDDINKGLKAVICIQIYNAYAMQGFWMPDYLQKSLDYIPFQVTARVPLAVEIAKRGNLELAKTLIGEAEAIAERGQSQLPNDFIYTKQEFTNLRKQIN